MTDIKLQDRVKHNRTDTNGIVIAIYADPETGKALLDVRSESYGDGNVSNGDGRIYYRTPAENWTVIRHEEDDFE